MNITLTKLFEEIITDFDWDQFEQLLKTFDWYYSYSDDFRVWKSGNEKYKIIMGMYEQAKQIDLERANQLWNMYSKG